MTDSNQSSDLAKRIERAIECEKRNLPLKASEVTINVLKDALTALRQNERLRAFAQDVWQHGPYNWQNTARAALDGKVNEHP